MKLQSSLHAIPREVAIKPRSAVSFWDEVNTIFDKIGKRAYELFEWRGRQDGHDLEDWLRAEQELLKPMPVEVSEKDNMIVVRAEVPGFKAEDLEVNMEPGFVVIKGRAEQETRKDVDKTFFMETKSNEIFRKIPLPVNVMADAGEAFLQDGVLEIKAPKAAEKQRSDIAA
jgi:HSP20 family protein